MEIVGDIDKLKRLGRDLLPEYEMVLSNDEEYAYRLQFDPQYSGKYIVIDREHLVGQLGRSFADALNTQLISHNVVVNALKHAGVNEIAFYRSYGAGMRPPAYKGGPQRRAHPGGWADITKNLRGSYKLTVQKESLEIHDVGGR